MARESNQTPHYLCLAGARVLTCDSGDTAYDRGEIWVKDGTIVSVGPGGSWAPPAEGTSIRRLDLPGRVVLPGLINGHAHSYAALLKGTVDVQTLDVYMLHVIAASAGRTPRDVYVSALVDALAMLRTGTTAVIDHFSHRPEPSAEAVMAAMQAYADIGLRATVAPMFADRPYAETVPLGRRPDETAASPRPSGDAGPDPVRYFEVMEEVLRSRGHFGERIGLLLGVDGPQRCSPRLIEMTADFMKRHGIGLHTHLLETKTQAVLAPSGGFVRDMAERGILNDRSSLVHFVWCTDEDIAAAREAGATIIHAPSSNLLLGSGICPLLRLLRAGLPVAVGTDGSNCGAPNMFENLRLAGSLARVTEPNFEAWVPARDMIKVALRNGARALGDAPGLGVLRAGAKADLLVLDPAKSLHRPMGDVWNHLLYYENGASVEHVFVAGRPVLQDGKIQTIDEDAILAEAEEIVARFRRRPQNSLSEVARQYPRYRDMVVQTLSRRDASDRLARLP